MSINIEKLAKQAGLDWKIAPPHFTNTSNPIDFPVNPNADLEKFARLIVAELAGLMEQTIDDVYALEPSERSSSYIDILQHWIDTFREQV